MQTVTQKIVHPNSNAIPLLADLRPHFPALNAIASCAGHGYFKPFNPLYYWTIHQYYKALHAHYRMSVCLTNELPIGLQLLAAYDKDKQEIERQFKLGILHKDSFLPVREFFDAQKTQLKTAETAQTTEPHETPANFPVCDVVISVGARGPEEPVAAPSPEETPLPAEIGLRM